MNQDQTGRKRSSKEIRRSLEETRERIEGDLTTLGDRIHRRLSLRRQIERHPILFAVAGAVVGFAIVRRPSLLFKAVRRLASVGAPLLVSGLLRSPPPASPPVEDE